MDILGNKYGRLLVISRTENSSKKHPKFLCKCDCGAIIEVYSQCLKSGTTRSCGCLRKEVSTALATKHGRYKTKLYNSWRGMKSRCLNPHDRKFDNYGGKGIRICSEWLKFEGFCQWAMENGYEEGLTIDRIDPNKDYKPKNCRWLTRAENVTRSNKDRHRKTKRSVRWQLLKK